MFNSVLRELRSGLTSQVNNVVNTVSNALTPPVLQASSLLDVPSFTVRSSNLLRDTFNDLVSDTRRVGGTLSFADGVVTSNLTTRQGPVQGTFNFVELGNSFARSLETLDGTLTVANGVLNGSVVTPLGSFQPANLNIADVAGTFAGLYLRQLNGTVPFNNGQIDVNLATPQGNIAGTVNFAGGRLTTNLTTPFGVIQGSSAFGEDAKIPFSFNRIPGIVDFSTGQISADVLPGLIGGEISIPFSSLGGNITFNNGVAEIKVPTQLGELSTSFDFASFADDNITKGLQGNGSVSFNRGVVNLDVTGPLGRVEGSFNVPEIVRNYVTSLQSVQGTVTFDNGVVNSNLNTPWGGVVNSLNLPDLLASIQPLLGTSTPATT
ncbi:MAG: hypothetical protein VKL59_10965 [Nostocaceae cyanobacterium]|nr:hypothetical protein [Nostocaceae cyanobacterium]